MYLHPRVDVHSRTRTQYHSLQTPSRYPYGCCMFCIIWFIYD
ncbi:unnamed protein product [Schistosoma curassoni]|uniref:Uncharacterized protein n=1 Tax=Schistosoma curassoni TaxID=6186 RepID=A0A183JGB5_9TREM|nr:unnamed protein product [Schistosoma curassoni]